MSSIISIGLPKTGTRSLMSCLCTLGYTHSSDTFQTRRLLDWCSNNYVLDPEDVQDEPAFAFWRGIADAYPKTRFIMTVRAFEPWYRSCAGLQVPYRLGPVTDKRRELEELTGRFGVPHTHTLDWMLGLVGGGWSYDRDYHDRVWQTHRAEVLEYFANQPERLLVWNLCMAGRDGARTRDADKWRPLCGFLGHPLPDVPLPWKHRTERQEAALALQETAEPDPWLDEPIDAETLADQRR